MIHDKLHHIFSYRDSDDELFEDLDEDNDKSGEDFPGDKEVSKPKDDDTESADNNDEDKEEDDDYNWNEGSEE